MSDHILGLDAKNRRNLMRGSLTLILLAAFQFALWWLFRWEVPQANRDMVVYMLGQLSGMLLSALAFFFNTSQSSSDKNDIMHRMTGQQTVKIEQPPESPVPVEIEADDAPRAPRPGDL